MDFYGYKWIAATNKFIKKNTHLQYPPFCAPTLCILHPLSSTSSFLLLRLSSFFRMASLSLLSSWWLGGGTLYSVPRAHCNNLLADVVLVGGLEYETIKLFLFVSVSLLEESIDSSLFKEISLGIKSPSPSSDSLVSISQTSVDISSTSCFLNDS